MRDVRFSGLVIFSKHRGQTLAARAPIFPLKISKEKKEKQSAAISLDKRKKTETFVEICEREQRYSIIQLRVSC